MATVSAPYGFQPVSHQTGTPRTTRMPFGIASGQSGNIFKFQPVKINSANGNIVPVTAITDKIFGIFAGVEFTPSGGRPAVSPYWPSGQTYDSSQDMNVYFWPAWDPTLRLQVQADGAVAQALMGFGFNIATPTAGSTVTGLSQAAVLHAGVASGAQGQFFLQEFATGVTDAYGGGDTYTDLIVSVAYYQVGPSPQVSI